MKDNKSVAAMIAALKQEYGQGECALHYEKPYELLIAARLSAQCTDERVNLITPALFERFPTMEAFAVADVKEVEEYVHSCGFYHAKARNIVDLCRMLLADYHGEIPNTIEELIKLPGVGRKTANLILGDIFGQPSVVADTHCIRISNLLGLCKTTDPAKVEQALRALLPPADSTMFCHHLVWHGRKVCIARRPQCANCCLAPWCDYVLGGTKAEPKPKAKKKRRAPKQETTKR